MTASTPAPLAAHPVTAKAGEVLCPSLTWSSRTILLNAQNELSHVTEHPHLASAASKLQLIYKDVWIAPPQCDQDPWNGSTIGGGSDSSGFVVDAKLVQAVLVGMMEIT